MVKINAKAVSISLSLPLIAAQPTVNVTSHQNQLRSYPAEQDHLHKAMGILVLESAELMTDVAIMDRWYEQIEIEGVDALGDHGLVKRKNHNHNHNHTIVVDPTPNKWLSELLNIAQLHEDKFNPKTPQEAWSSNSALPHDYWMRSKSSLEASGVSKFWKAFSEEYRGNDSFKCKQMKRGPMNCFALNFWGDLDFSCSIDKTEACQSPDPERIIRYVEAHWNEYTTENKVAMARIIYFTAQSFRAIHWNLASKHVSKLFSNSNLYASNHS